MVPVACCDLFRRPLHAHAHAHAHARALNLVTSLQFWFARTELVETGLLMPDAPTVPSAGRLCGQLVEFADYQKTAAAAGTKCDFDLSAYDRATEEHQAADGPCATWEYQFTPCSEPFTIVNFDFSAAVGDVSGTSAATQSRRRHSCCKENCADRCFAGSSACCFGPALGDIPTDGTSLA